MTAPPDPDTTISDWVAETLAVAAEATPGPWAAESSQGGRFYEVGRVVDGEIDWTHEVCATASNDVANAAFIARCDPATITALINVVAAANRRRQARWLINDGSDESGYFDSDWHEYDESENAEDAALDALAARLRGEG